MSDPIKIVIDTLTAPIPINIAIDTVTKPTPVIVQMASLGANGTVFFDEIAQARGKHTTLYNRIDEQEISILKARAELFGDVKGALQMGYYDYGTGFLVTSGVGWHNFYVRNGENKNYMLDCPFGVTARLVEFNTIDQVIASSIIPSGDFTVGPSCVKFAVNMRLPDSVPPSVTVSPISGMSDLYATVISIGVGMVAEKKPLNVTLKAGMYYTGSGAFALGVSWDHFYAQTSGNRRFVLDNPVIGSVRLVEFLNGAYLTHSTVTTNVPFEVSATCTQFALNVRGVDSVPASADLTVFSDKTEFLLHVFPVTSDGVSLVSQVQKLTEMAMVDVTNDKIMKILSIGNSFSDDSFEHLHTIAKTAGIDTVIGVMYIGGGSLAQHWTNIQTNGTYEYRKWTKEQGKIHTLGKTIPQAVIDEDWDIIVFQQASNESGIYSSFQPYLNDIRSYVNGIATNPDVKYALNMTWAYASTSSHTGFASYGGNQLTMYGAITEAYRQAVLGSNINIVLPTGTAIQNARTVTQMKAVEQELTRDGHHLGYSLGRLIANYTVFEVLLASYYKKDLYTDVSFGHVSSAGMVYFAKVSAKNAVVNPFKITTV